MTTVFTPLEGESWGFQGHDARLKRGNVGSSPTLRVRGVPFARYDVVVHLGAGADNVQGNLFLSPAGSGAIGFAFNFGWNGGKHAIATARPGESAPCSNYAVFRGVAGPSFDLRMEKTGGKGWTGISAIQIVPR